ncbi:hypothetical protein [Streptomyces sp. NPDC090057]|uniref:hypothetical protein n=1 Tax=Streptomyces sp. NPDC090057 TaxID=3365935 RepID=UPI0038064813
MRGSAVVATVAGRLLPGGCAAVDLPPAGVGTGADGAPYALIRPCGADAHQGPRQDGRPRGGGEGPVTTGGDVRQEGLHGDADFPLFTPPGSRRARHRGERRLLPRHRCEPGFGHYATGDSYNGRVEFTGERIGRLRPGQVWADGRVTGRAGFERLAAGSC